MTIDSTLASDRRPTRQFVPDAHGLRGEHAALLRGVQRRAAPVLALADVRTWPAAELRTLISFVRTEVLRRASAEERELHPDDRASAPFAELSADHVHLHTLTEHLDQVAGESCSLAELTALINDLLATLERHLIDEQAVLAALPGASEHPVVALDHLPIGRAVQLAIERLLRMQPAEIVEVRSSSPTELRLVWDWMRRYDTIGYGFSQTEIGSRQWGLQVTRGQIT